MNDNENTPLTEGETPAEELPAEDIPAEEPADSGEDVTESEEPASAEEPPAEPTPAERRFKAVRTAFEYIETFCVALAVMIVLFLFFFRNVTVDGASMHPTLHGGEYYTGDTYVNHADTLIISDFLYTPKTGDIVVLNVKDHSQPLIKRVIAVGGQEVEINFKEWTIKVDGVLLEEPYINRVSADMSHGGMDMDSNGVCTFTVSEGKVFVLGDNRNNSSDSRDASVGEQDIENILGKVILRVFPLAEFGGVD